MRFLSKFVNTLSLEHNVMSLIQNSTNQNHLLQIHAFIFKTSLDRNFFVIGKLLGKILSHLTPTNNDFSYARSVFDSITQPDTFLFNTMIRGYLKCNNPDECLFLFSRIYNQNEFFIDSFSLSLVLQSCGRLIDCKNGKSLHSHTLKLGFGCDLFVQTALIEMYAKFGLMVVSRKVFDEIKEPDLVSCNVMLAEYVRAGDMSRANNLFDKMSERDLVSWNTIIHGYALLGGLAAAQALFDTSSKEVFSRCSTIAGRVNSRCSYNALKLFHEMQLSNVVPDKVTMVSVLCACGDVGALGMGKMIHEYIVRSRIDIDMKLGTSVVDMYAKCGDIDNAIRIFNQMKKKDVFAWSAMIMGLANHGFGESALELFSRMISEGTKPNNFTFTAVLTACSHFGLVDKGWSFFHAMSKAYGIPPKIEHYGNMIGMLSRAGKLEDARELITTMPFKPDVVVWRALLGACEIHTNIKLAEEAMMNIVSLEPNVDGNFVLMSNVYSQAKLWDKVVKARKIMKINKIRKIPGSSSIEVSNTVHEFVASDKSHPHSDEIYKMLAELMYRLRQVGCQPSTDSARC